FCLFPPPATTSIYTLSLHDALPICHIVRGYGSVMIEGIRDFMPDIAIRTTANAAVSSIFDGEVVQVYPGIVVIKHGSYFSFYSNLASTSVRRGQKVSRGQQIGNAAEDPDLGFPVV